MLPTNENRLPDSAEDNQRHERRVENDIFNKNNNNDGEGNFVRVEDKDYQEEETESTPFHRITSTEDREELGYHEDEDDKESIEAVEEMGAEGDPDNWRNTEVFEDDDEIADRIFEVDVGDVNMNDLLEMEEDGLENVVDELHRTAPVDFTPRPWTQNWPQSGNEFQSHPGTDNRRPLFLLEPPSEPPDIDLPPIEVVKTEMQAFKPTANMLD